MDESRGSKAEGIMGRKKKKTLIPSSHHPSHSRANLLNSRETGNKSRRGGNFYSYPCSYDGGAQKKLRKPDKQCIHQLKHFC